MWSWPKIFSRPPSLPRLVARPSRSRYPLFHVAPPVGRLNDPNGLIEVGGTYHAFFQYTPEHPRKLVYWGHATSRDLTRWDYHAPAILPDARQDLTARTRAPPSTPGTTSSCGTPATTRTPRRGSARLPSASSPRPTWSTLRSRCPRSSPASPRATPLTSATRRCGAMWTDPIGCCSAFNARTSRVRLCSTAPRTCARGSARGRCPSRTPTARSMRSVTCGSVPTWCASSTRRLTSARRPHHLPAGHLAGARGFRERLPVHRHRRRARGHRAARG